LNSCGILVKWYSLDERTGKQNKAKEKEKEKEMIVK
jgi:hypothetical protein